MNLLLIGTTHDDKSPGNAYRTSFADFSADRRNSSFAGAYLVSPLPVELDVQDDVWVILPIRIAINVLKALEFPDRFRLWRRDRAEPLPLRALILDAARSRLVSELRWYDDTPDPPGAHPHDCLLQARYCRPVAQLPTIGCARILGRINLGSIPSSCEEKHIFTRSEDGLQEKDPFVSSSKELTRGTHNVIDRHGFADLLSFSQRHRSQH